MKIIFASNNENKAAEIRALLPRHFQVLTMKDAGMDIEIEEPHDTLEENALEKARILFGLLKENCFADDSGLEVAALGGEPGVKSARYAGEERSHDLNMKKLLSKMKGFSDRSARFRSVIALIVDGKEFLFEGICDGYITTERKGTEGFGYDPIFVPEGSNLTFGEMNMDEKNQFNHRAKAVAKLVVFLNKLSNNQ